jgi:hypothetical protein
MVNFGANDVAVGVSSVDAVAFGEEVFESAGLRGRDRCDRKIASLE